jgi:hypothetical protein
MKGSIRSPAPIAGSIVAASSGCRDPYTITGPSVFLRTIIELPGNGGEPDRA